MPNTEYTAAQLIRAANISTTTYNQWRARGFITRKAAGSGNRQTYTEEQVYRVAVLAELVGLGMSPGTAFVHVTDRMLFTGGEKELCFFAIYRTTEGEEVSAFVPEKKLLKWLAQHNGAVVLCLDKIWDRVKHELGA